jgi:hypothetical protein
MAGESERARASQNKPNRLSTKEAETMGKNKKEETKKKSNGIISSFMFCPFPPPPWRKLKGIKDK